MSITTAHNNRINSDWQWSAAELLAGYADRSAKGRVMRHERLVAIVEIACG